MILDIFSLKITVIHLDLIETSSIFRVRGCLYCM